MKIYINYVALLCAIICSPAQGFELGKFTGKTYASEINYNAAGDPAGAAIKTRQNIEVPLGATIGKFENRYVRFDFINATISGSVNGVSVGLSDIALPAPDQFHDRVIDGGTEGDSCVVYEVTGGPVDHKKENILQWELPFLNILSNNIKNQLTYRMYETLIEASCVTTPKGDGLAASVTGELFPMVDSLVLTSVISPATTALSEFLYTKTDDSAPLNIHLATLGVSFASIDKVAGIESRQTIALIVEGDFTATRKTGSVVLKTKGNSCDKDQGAVVSVANISDPMMAEFTKLDITANEKVTYELCYNAEPEGDQKEESQKTGARAKLAFMASRYQARLKLLTARANDDKRPLVSAGRVKRNGMVLISPFIESSTAGAAFIQLINYSPVGTTFSVRCLDSRTDPVVGAANVALPAKSTLNKSYAALGCAAKNGELVTEGDMAIELILNATQGAIGGYAGKISAASGAITGVSRMTGDVVIYSHLLEKRRILDR